MKELVRIIHNVACEKGFYDKPNQIIKKMRFGVDEFTEHEIEYVKNAFNAQRLMLVVTEVAEAMEAIRHNDKANFEEELADTVIRIFDMCGHNGIDIGKAIRDKTEKNMQRPQMHGKKC
jgi:NTP pyrophosphatase (non-canonical NTP hydrolase)